MAIANVSYCPTKGLAESFSNTINHLVRIHRHHVALDLVYLDRSLNSTWIMIRVGSPPVALGTARRFVISAFDLCLVD